jgi:hypothetical protein
MFGLSIIQERAAFIAVLVLVVIGAAWHERYVGAQGCLKNVEKANVVETAKEEKQHTADTTTVQTEAKTYAAAKSAPLTVPAPRIGLCPALPRKALSGTPAPGSAPNAGTPGGGADTVKPTFWDTTALVKAGRDADAQIRGLQDYIITVCRPQ